MTQRFVTQGCPTLRKQTGLHTSCFHTICTCMFHRVGEKFDTPPLKPTKTKPSFRKLNSPPTKLCILFPAHLQARELRPQTYSLSLPLEWSQVTHIPTSYSIKLGGAYKPKKSAFYNTFARQLCDDIRLPGWLSAFPPHSQTFKPTQASFAHTNSQPSHSTSYKIFFVFFVVVVVLSAGGFLQGFAQPPPEHYKGLQATSKGHTPFLILIATMGKCKQANKANKFQSHDMVT